MSNPTPHLRRVWSAAATALCLLWLTGCNDKSAEEYIRDAQAHRAQRQMGAAIIDLKNALQQEPKNVRARLLLAEYDLDLTDAVAADTEIQHARQDGADVISTAALLGRAELLEGKPEQVLKDTNFPDSPAPEPKAALLAVRGQALIALNRFDDARESLDEALKLNSKSVDALAGLVRLALEQNDLTAARARLAEAQQIDANDPTLFSLEGTIDFVAKDLPASESAFSKMLATAPWSLSARLGIARAQIAQEKLKEAADNLDAVLKLAPNDPNSHYLRALAAYREKDYDTADQHIQRTLALTKPAAAPTLLLAGAVSYARKQYAQAITYLNQYVYLVPNNPQALKILAAAQIASGRPGDAVKTLSASADTSDDTQTLAMIGEAAARSGDLTAANRYLTRAVQTRPDSTDLRTELGVVQVALGQTDAGVDELEKAAQQDPDALRPEVALFSAYMRNKLYDKALQVAQRVQQSKTQSSVGFDLEGLVDAAKNDADGARKNFLKARELQPNDALALRMLASLEYRAKNFGAAEQYLQEIIRSNPKNIQAYVDLAELERVQNQGDQVLATLKQAVEQNPDVPATRILLGRVLLVTGKLQDALDAVGPVLAKDPKNGPALEVQGEAELVLRNAEGAVATFTTLVGAQPQSSAAHRYLAQAYAAANELDLAIPEAQKAVELAPKDIATSLDLVKLYVAKKDFKSAHQVLDKLTADNPNNPSILAITGEVAMAEHHPEDAVAAYTLALDIADSGIIRGQLASAMAAAGRFDEAEKMLKPWVEAHPDDLNGRMALGDLYLTERHLDDAEQQYETAASKFPGSALAENNLAWTLSLLGRSADALPHAQRAAALVPNSPDVQDTLAVVLLQAKNPAEAVTAAQKATALAPANPEFQFHLAQALVQSGDKDKARTVLKTLLESSATFTDRHTAEQLMAQLGS